MARYGSRLVPTRLDVTHPEGVVVTISHPGFIDTDVAADVPFPKASARQVADRSLDGWEAGVTSVFPDRLGDRSAPSPMHRRWGPEDLILSHFSLGRFLPFDVRVKAAAEAGFAAIGFYVGDYLRLRAERRTDADLRDVLKTHGMGVAGLEALRGWSATGESRTHTWPTKRLSCA